MSAGLKLTPDAFARTKRVVKAYESITDLTHPKPFTEQPIWGGTSIIRCRILDEYTCGEMYQGVVVTAIDSGNDPSDDTFGHGSDSGDTDEYGTDSELIIIRNLALSGSEGHSLTIETNYQYRTYFGVDSGIVEPGTGGLRIIDIRDFAISPGCAGIGSSSSSG